jgi:Ca-activated chloride channel family protein
MQNMARVAAACAAAVIAAAVLHACAMKQDQFAVERLESAADKAAAAAAQAESDATRAREAAAQAEGAAQKSESMFAKGLRNGGDVHFIETGPVVARAAGPAPAVPAPGQADAGEFPASLSYAGEELWVIARAPESDQPAAPSEVLPPSLRAKPPGASEEIPLPLKHTDVQASIAAYIATVHVTQQYHNPYGEKIEAVYVFPLPPDAAVNEFVMTIGERHIRGIIREREEAERVYEEAKRQGYVASLLTQERPNIFTQSVANIEPGKAIDIELTYFHTLHYRDGEYEFVFPMVVGPRFNPPGSTTGVGAVPRGRHGSSGQATEVQYLKPGERSGHDIGLAVDVEAGVTIEALASPSHAIETTVLSPTRRRVALSRLDTIPNKDFVLRYKVAGKTIKTAFLAHHDQRGGFFTLMLQPPAQLAGLPRAPTELVFVLDCSGSMQGAPLAIAKAAVRRALTRLGPDDTFQIVRFSDDASQLGAHPVPATAENVARGLTYLDALESEGGTMMIEGIKAALDFPHDPRRLRIVSFLTDGYIGNEAEILGEIHKRLGAARLFSFGIGSATNHYLLDRMALLGKGAVAYVGLDESTARAVDGFYERVAHPALTDLHVAWGGLKVTDVYPRRVPDLFVGRPVVLTGRFHGEAKTTITVRGRAAGAQQEIAVPIDTREAGSTHPALASVWARNKIADLEDRAAYEHRDGIATEIKNTALSYGLMSAYTAFVAVDSGARTAGTKGTTVAVPVPVPEGVPYETTVQEKER